MAASSRNTSGPVLRSLSPVSYSPSRFASSSSTSTTFTSPSSTARFNLRGSSVRFALDRSVSPNRSISFSGGQTVKRKSHHQKPACMCSPTTHSGSFRCGLHKSFGSRTVAVAPPNRLNARRSAMTNSLVRIRGVEGELVKRALASLIRPSSHQQRRRSHFRSRPSRLSAMSKAERDS